jgi:hypothetical protein
MKNTFLSIMLGKGTERKISGNYFMLTASCFTNEETEELVVIKRNKTRSQF